MRRRDFLKLAAVSSTGAVLFTGCSLGTIGDGDPAHEFKLESPVYNPNDLRYGRDNWYATAAPASLGGDGLIVRVFEGRAKKVDGNPDFPTNRGKSSAVIQALVTELYHPDRVASPVKRSGDRGSGQFQPLNWNDALAQVANAIKAAPQATLLITEPLNGALGAVINAFVKATGVQLATFEPDERIVLREAMRRTFGVATLPTLDLANANFLLDFGADFLHGWIAPVQFARAFGQFRQGRSNARGLFYFLGPRMAATAANADRWYAIKPGSEGLIALAMAQVILSENLADSTGSNAFLQALGLTRQQLDQNFTPEKVADAAGISADQIRTIARLFAQRKPSIAIAGTTAAAHTNGLFNLVAVFALNYLVGSVNTQGGVILNPPVPLGDQLPAHQNGTPYTTWVQLSNAIKSGQIKTVLIHRVNPVYHLPPASGFADALRNAGTVISVGTVFDDTALLADIVLPEHTLFEEWDIVVPDPGPGFPALTLRQPVVNPFVDSRAFGDILIQIGKQLGASMPWESQEAAVRALADTLRQRGGGNITASDPREYFMIMQTQGGWWNEQQKVTSTPQPSKATAPANPEFAGDSGQYPFYLLPFPSGVVGYGQWSHLPWVQGLQDQISTIAWQTWVEVNPKTGEQLGIGTGDIIRIETPQGSIEVPVYINPAAPPDVLAVPLGQGHTGGGRYAKGFGANVLNVVQPATEKETGALAWAATRCRIAKTGRRARISQFEGAVPAFQLEEAPIVQLKPMKV